MRRVRLSAAVLALLLAACPLAPVALGAEAPAAPPRPTIASRLQPFVDSHTLAGAVTLVASKDAVLSLEAVGWADVPAQKPMRTDALFWIASMSKPMTATALMMLVDEGKVRVDDPVERHLPEFQGQMLAVEQGQERWLLQKPARPITVRDVLTHTSGLPYQSRVERKIDERPLREAVLSYAMTPLKSEPGTKHEYSNAGINTAGRIIEVVSGMPYEEFMQKRLFDPLGMKDTTFWPTEEQLQRLAKAYKPGPGNAGLVETPIGHLTYPLTDRRRGPSPAGGLFATASDVACFCQMVLAGGLFGGKRFLSEAAVKQMTRRQTPDTLKESYGLGWAVGPDWFGHGGAYATNMTIDPPRGLLTVFMVQHAGFPGDGGKAHPAFRQAAIEAFGQ